MTAVAPNYFDFNGLGRMKGEAARESPQAAREAARQFESLFVQMMLKSMRAAGAVIGEERDTTYEEMFDRQISLELTRGKGLGIADLMMRQLGLPDADTAGLKASLAGARDRANTPPAPLAASEKPATVREDFRPNGPEDFISRLWPLARDAGRELNVDPRALVAQAALETGWGQKVLRDEKGVSGNNLFNIKADHRWGGERLSVRTVEYEGGIASLKKAAFRTYDTLKESFDDYVNFLKSNPRYEKVASGGLSSGDYARALQDAGYATDPAYASKIVGILDASVFDRTVSAIKGAADLPNWL